MDEEEVYEIWVNRIIQRYEKGDWEGEAGLRKHMMHHALEIEDYETTSEWLASMSTLVDIAKRLSGYDVDITINKFFFDEEEWNSEKKLRDNIIVHVMKLKGVKITSYHFFEWFVTMTMLLDTTVRLTCQGITKRLQLERLYLHWKEDMNNMEPPPFEVCLLDKKVEVERVSSGRDTWNNWRPGDS